MLETRSQIIKEKFIKRDFVVISCYIHIIIANVMTKTLNLKQTNQIANFGRSSAQRNRLKQSSLDSTAGAIGILDGMGRSAVNLQDYLQ